MTTPTPSKRLTDQDGSALVKELLQDPDPAARSAALGTLDVFSQDFAQPLAQAALADADPGVKSAAQAALEAIAAARRGEGLEGG